MQDSKGISEQLTGFERVDVLLKREHIYRSDIATLTAGERTYYDQVCKKNINTLTGNVRDKYIAKIQDTMSLETNQQVWDYNHQTIAAAISKSIQDCGVMPPQTTLAAQTGLSRKAISKHLAAYKTNPVYLEEKEQFKLMTSHVLANVYKSAIKGSVKAAKLYFDMVGASNKQGNTVINAQNNYIQINNTILSQEKIKQMSVEQLAQIESIVTAAIPVLK
jgi:biotin operon repressor